MIQPINLTVPSFSCMLPLRAMPRYPLTAKHALKITSVALVYLNLASNFGLCAMGLKELFIDKLVKPGAVDQKPAGSRMEIALQWFSNLIKQNSSKPFDRVLHMANGLFYLGSGICGIACGLEALERIELGKMAPVMNQLSNGLFMMANLVLLESYITNYVEAAKNAAEGSPEDRMKASLQKRSAVLGILNTVSYIFGASMNLMGFFPAIALLLGCIGALFGAVKVLYDFYYEHEVSRQTYSGAAPA